MFERYLTDLLTTHFGHVIEGLDSDKVRLSAWNGEIVLKDLSLKRDALDHFMGVNAHGNKTNCPVEIAYGRVGNLEIRIPWKLVRSQMFWYSSSSEREKQQQIQNQCSVFIQDVNILVKPVTGKRRKRERSEHESSSNDDNPDAWSTPKHSDKEKGKAEQIQESQKEEAAEIIHGDKAANDGTDCDKDPHKWVQKELAAQSLLDKELLKRVTESSSSSSTDSSKEEEPATAVRLKWIQERLAGILSNLSVTFKNIHVRYEDSGKFSSWNYRGNSTQQQTPFQTPARNYRGGRHYRRPFAIGITLNQFSIQTTNPEHVQKQHQPKQNSPQKRDSDDRMDSFSLSSSANSTTQLDDAFRMKADLQSRDKESSTDSSTPPEEKDNGGAVKIRHKIAAVYQLAVYWDSGCPIMSSKFKERPTEAEDREIKLPDERRNTGQLQQKQMSLENQYCEAAFALLNGEVQERAQPQEKVDAAESNVEGKGAVAKYALQHDQYPRPEDFSPNSHSFLLDSFSPHITFELVTDSSSTSADDGSATLGKGEIAAEDEFRKEQKGISEESRHVQQRVPPSRVTVFLPPCRWNLSRGLLKDAGYLRKCAAVWSLQRKTAGSFHLSDANLNRLTQLRPKNSPLNDPRSWWKYILEVVLALQESERKQQQRQSLRQCDIPQNDSLIGFRRRRRKGWLGLTSVLRDRRRYVDLYNKLVVEAKEQQERLGLHSALLVFERELLASEIAAFRIYAYSRIQEGSPDMVFGDDSVAVRYFLPNSTDHSGRSFLPSVSIEDDLVDSISSLNESDASTLSLEHRLRMFTEMSRALDQEMVNVAANGKKQHVQSNYDSEQSSSTVGTSAVSNHDDEQILSYPVTWELSLSCPEISLQVNDQRSCNAGGYRMLLQPVVRLSCTFMLEQKLFLDGSWELVSQIASLVVKDCTSEVTSGEPSLRRHSNGGERIFPYLVGPKVGNRKQVSETTDTDQEIVYLNGVPYDQSITIRIRRSQWRSEGKQGSTISTQVRVLPVEIVYSTAPVEALSRILDSGTASSELLDDYQRMATKLMEWRERQRKRLVRALAHKQKKILVDVDVGAPVFLIPEESRGRRNIKNSCPLLVVDLGRLQIHNATRNEEQEDATSNVHPSTTDGFDDHWHLKLTSMQVQCSSTHDYRNPIATDVTAIEHDQNERLVQQVVEPFSLHFDVSTRFREGHEIEKDGVGSSVQILATLPRLAFNLTSSAMRLILRLQKQWEERKQKQQPLSSNFATEDQPAESTIDMVDQYSLRPNVPPSVTVSPSPPSSPNASMGQRLEIVDRKLEFRFMAPLLIFKLENDVDGRDCHPAGSYTNVSAAPVKSTLLVDLALRGTECEVRNEISSGGMSKLAWTAKLRALDAVDLYQGAGDDYAFLLSSVSPELISPARRTVDYVCDAGRRNDGENMSQASLIGMDLVKFAYSSIKNSESLPNFPVDDRYGGAQQKILVDPGATNKSPENNVDKLLIQFHELYVEWNPETVAAIHKAMQLPKDELPDPTDTVICSQASPNGSDDVSEDDEESTFYDAQEQEDDFYDAQTVTSFYSISEISSSQRSSFASLSDFKMPPVVAAEQPETMAQLQHPFHTQSEVITRLFSPHPGVIASPLPLSRAVYSKSPQVPKIEPIPQNSFEIEFKLSKLRVNFNKDFRHRRLITAEMDRTSVRRTILQKGGSRTLATIGNLTFSDSDCVHNKTLYREILGLKTAGTQSSLLELEMVKSPRKRCYNPHQADNENIQEAGNGVYIDLSKGSMRGSDLFLRARFSPMRFVLLEELWMEFIDYFFEGIIGDEVWGNEPPQSLDEAALKGTELAEKVKFTRFDIVMESPVILMPVSYCSTDSMRFEAERIAMSNHFNCGVMRDQPLDSDKQQWYNNCDIVMDNLKLFSSSGRELSRQEDSVGATISLNWPSGPMARLNVPKWKVEACFDAMYISLQREDYALFQHVIQHNIGEGSRHMDEWRALQSLPPLILERYMKAPMVNFGYDEKDVTPTTYDMSIKMPILCFTFTNEHQQDIAVTRFVDFVWGYKKLSNLISRQTITCDVCIDESSNGNFHLLSSHKNRSQQSTFTPDLTYTSTSKPSGDNKKTLDIVDASIDVVYPAWKRLSSFFQGLPEPNFLSPSDAIQVGDRWYKIGNQASAPSLESSCPRFTWIAEQDLNLKLSPITEAKSHIANPTYCFRLFLTRPRVVLSSKDSSLVLSMKSIEFVHDSNRILIERNFTLTDIELYTRSPDRATRSEDHSFIHPWTIVGSIKRRNGRLSCECESHVVNIAGDELKARAANSDMTIAMDACLRLVQDMKAPSASKNSLVETKSSEAPSESESHGSQIAEKSAHSIKWKGIRFVVVDDSCRHFAGSQELAILEVGNIDFLRIERKVDDPISLNSLPSRMASSTKYSMRLRITSVELLDCLQQDTSKFRSVISIRSDGKGEKLSTVPSDRNVDGGRVAPSEPFEFGVVNNQTESFQTVNSKDDVVYAVELSSIVDVSRSYRAQVHSVALQYNPSMVIALQRFLGRFAKDVHEKVEKQLKQPEYNDSELSEEASPPSSPIQESMVLQGSIEVSSLSICLNKEHQGRQLLKSNVLDCFVKARRTESGLAIHGHVGELFVTGIDSADRSGLILDSNKPFLKVPAGVERFLEFNYMTFANRSIPQKTHRGVIPKWVLDHVDEQSQGIDDYLDLSVSAVEIVFLRERTEELVDYLSNGMPGKGMGATSRAAQGFVSKRIRTKSFLQVCVDAPRVWIPQHENAENGMAFRLGDLSLRSWIAEHSERNSELARMLSISLSGVSCSVYRHTGSGTMDSAILSNIDMSIEVSKTESLISLATKLSDVHISLSYTNYVTVLHVVKENIARRLDKKRWDNLEVAWEKESSGEDGTMADLYQYSKYISYSTSARHVRYGRKKQSSPSESLAKYDIKLCFDHFSAVLSRDDPIDDGHSPAPMLSYDMLLTRGHGFEASLFTGKDGFLSLGLSLKKIFVFDLGERGRLIREQYHIQAGEKLPSTFSVLVEGYSPPEKRSRDNDDHFDSQFVIRLDRNVSSKADTKVSVVINYLSITALTRPLQETLDFLTCSWPGLGETPVKVKEVCDENHVNKAWNANSEALCGSSSHTGDVSKDTTDLLLPPKLSGKPSSIPEDDSPSSTTSHFEVKLVLHYPRLIFVADEVDRHSRGLMLRGLALVNASYQQSSASGATKDQDGAVIQVNADFQNISSHIHPDVSDFLVLHRRGGEDLASVSPLEINRYAESDSPGEGNDPGIPLLLPLTIGIEFEQVGRFQSPTRRSLFVNMDPLSILVSFEDLQLIKAVMNKLPSKQSSQKTGTRTNLYDVVFHSKKLGLALRKESDAIVVDNVTESAHQESIQAGDAIHAINGIVVSNLEKTLSLSDIVSRLASEPRPTRITLARTTDSFFSDNGDGSAIAPSTDGAYKSSVDKFDFSLSAAVFTVMDKEVPLARGQLSTTELGSQLSRTNGTILNLNFSSTVGIEYYNLRVWGWEPLLEQGCVFLSAEYQEPCQGPRELAFEIGDQLKGPLCVNVTDASAEIMNRILVWGQETEEDDDDNFDVALIDEHMLSDSEADRDTDEEKLLVSRKAANAALKFARRQRHHKGKPFVFRNTTGLSVAFVKQKHGDRTYSRDLNGSSVAVGEYNGLQAYENSEITVVANGEESLFHVDVIPETGGVHRKPTSNDNDGDGGGRFPLLTVALQTVNGVTIEPIRDLQISRPEESLVPLEFVRKEDGNLEDTTPCQQWVTWLVDQENEEKTVVTLGSALHIVSLSLTSTFELGIETGVCENKLYDDTLVNSIGTVRFGTPFYLPLWLGFRQTAWRCSIKPIHSAGDYRFAPLFESAPDGTINFSFHSKKHIECRAKREDTSSMWLAAVHEQDDEIFAISVDCSLSVCNLLPTDIEWEVASSTSNEILDGSTLREDFLVKSAENVLKTGACAEVFVESGALKAHFRRKQDVRWSTWASLAVQPKKKQRKEKGIGGAHRGEGNASSLSVELKDSFGVPLTLGVRIAEKVCGLEVTLYAEFWFSNCTSLPLVFGCPKDQVFSQIQNEIDMPSNEVSAAQAALKEMSSLFETGEEGTGLQQPTSRNNSCVTEVCRFPAQSGVVITEECFEYIKVNVDQSTILRRWWASEDPQSLQEDITGVEEDGSDWQWLDKAWATDLEGNTSEGWESSPTKTEFSERRKFSPNDKYRRRRLFRTREAGSAGSLADGINAFHQPVHPLAPMHREGKAERMNTRVAIQVGGGRWALTSKIPNHGTVYGALRAAGTRWPQSLAPRGGNTGMSSQACVYELCYAISPLEGSWGDLSRVMLITSRFLLRNDSRSVMFEVKQAGTCDASAVRISPGQMVPFHWTDFRLPQLVSVRPVVKCEGHCIYRWSGGFDPLTIGAVPLRIRRISGTPIPVDSQWHIRSLKMEAEIRTRTGGTGINLSFQEEDEKGDGALFRVENSSTFPIWIAQDGILANPSQDAKDASEMEGDLLQPGGRMCFGLDVPFRQGKYSHRKAATMTELLRLRLGLAPLLSRGGIETTKVISLTAIGERVRLNPSKLMVLGADIRLALERVRIVGVISNDGPTRVLKLRLMEKKPIDSVFGNPFRDESIASNQKIFSGQPFFQEIVNAAETTRIFKSQNTLPTEEEAVRMTHLDTAHISGRDESSPPSLDEQTKDFIISFRAAFSGFVVSLVDSVPSEIVVMAFRNVNALANWNRNRTTDSTVYVTITDVQVDNMVPNAPFPVAVCYDEAREITGPEGSESEVSRPPLLVIGLSFAPRHESGVVCLRSVTVAPRNLALRVDLAFLVRLQKYAIDLQGHFHKSQKQWGSTLSLPDIKQKVSELEAAASSNAERQKFYIGGFTILPCNIKLSVAPAKALTAAQAVLEGPTAAAIHQAVRKGDVGIYDDGALLGVKVGHRNSTPLAVVRGVFKSIVVDALLRLNGASLNFAGVSLRNHTSTGGQLRTYVGAHYRESLRQNFPNLVGSLAAFGNPLGLVRGLGDGVSDFVLEPVKGFQRSVQQMDASYLVDGVARGTVSLARHTVGGFADSAAMLAETFSKNMAVLTLDRRYAQRRDRGETLRDFQDINVALGLGSGVQKLGQGFLDGVTGVVKAPIRGAEKKGFEGFAKGIGKGLLGLLVKPIIGLSDGITDVMIGVKGSVDGASVSNTSQTRQIRPRRPLYGRERFLRPYDLADAAAAALMLRTRLAGENYLSHVDMGDRVALLSVKRLLLLGSTGSEMLVLKFKHIDSIEVRSIEQADGSPGWGIVIVLNTPRRDGSEVEVINCSDQGQATLLCSHIESGMRQVTNELALEQSPSPNANNK